MSEASRLGERVTTGKDCLEGRLQQCGKPASSYDTGLLSFPFFPAHDGAAGDACSTQASGDEPRRAAGLLEAAVRLRVHILRPRGRGLRPPEIT